jgi:hypothetical protein
MEKMTFLAEEIFVNIPYDPDNVIMRIPPQIREACGWNEGDILTIKVEDNAIVISKNG